MMMAAIAADDKDNQDNDQDQDDNIVDGGVIAVEAAADGAIHDVIGNHNAMQIARRGIDLLRRLLLRL